jgi:endonuclease-3
MDGAKRQASKGGSRKIASTAKTRCPKEPGRGGLGEHFPLRLALERVAEENKKFHRQTLHAVEKIRVDPFRVLIACLLSLRTRDPQTLIASARLFERADTPEGLLALGVEEIAKLIEAVSYPGRKAEQIVGICQKLLDEYGGQVPSSIEELLEFKGVGRKTANLTRTLGFGLPGICVDTHVHRICNRWGYVETREPDETEMRLREILPPEFWIPINDWLVVFGQNVCQPLAPRCSECPLTDLCRRVGVHRSR